MLAKDKNAEVLSVLVRMQSVPEIMQQVIAKHRDPIQSCCILLLDTQQARRFLRALKAKGGVKYASVRARALRQLSIYGDSPMRQKNLIEEDGEEDEDDYDDTWQRLVLMKPAKLNCFAGFVVYSVFLRVLIFYVWNTRG